jgi:dipeptidyl aminopeptidase/acylaminoacyl peptidase
LKETIKIAAIVDKYGITDVAKWANHSRSAITWLGAKFGDEAFTRSVSPMFYVNEKNPPVFIVHGDADPIVPYSESVELHKALTDAGIKTVFITVPGGEHGKFTKEKNQEINESIITFLKDIKVIP